MSLAARSLCSAAWYFRNGCVASLQRFVLVPPKRKGFGEAGGRWSCWAIVAPSLAGLLLAVFRVLGNIRSC